jgi:hypothetical protein
MGQYYKPVNLTKNEYLYTHDFKSRFKRSDGEVYYMGEGLKLMEHSYIGNKLMNAVERLLIPGGDWYECRLVWAGDYADNENGKPDNVYIIMGETGKKIIPSSKKVPAKFRYRTNFTKRQVIDLSTIRAVEDGWKIHPLSLLGCEGNGRGGGDFRGNDERIGSWARDVISLEDHVRDGYTVIDGQFREN